MSAGIKANVDGSGAIQVGGTDVITISSDGAVAIPQTFSVTGALTASTIKSNTSSPPTIQNSSGTEIGTLCRAWVNFNGTGTVAIRASFNVSSITDNGTGQYRITFQNALPDANYSLAAMPSGSGTGQILVDNGVINSAYVEIRVVTGGGSLFDSTTVAVMFMR
jgi:hypothetical protein